MEKVTTSKVELDIKPATPERWDDIVELFGKSGAYGGCWCMYWRLTGAQWARQQGRGNKEAFRKITKLGQVPGLLAYVDRTAVGWCSVAPRTEFGRLERSRILKRIDEKPVWSIVCFFVAPGWRRQGILLGLIEGVVDYVRAQGGKVVEAYPLNPAPRSPMENYMGLTSTFLTAGFEEVARPSDSRFVVRYYL